MRKIIFLDVDGVLNSMPYIEHLKKKGEKSDENGGFDDISDYHLEMLSEIYHTCQAKIVLTSTWRTLPETHPMYQYLVDSLAKYDMRISAKTPVLGMNRPLEIVTWMNNQEKKEEIRFVSLDDDFSERDYAEYGIEGHLVQTRYFCYEMAEGGLQKEHVEKAIQILNT